VRVLGLVDAGGMADSTPHFQFLPAFHIPLVIELCQEAGSLAEGSRSVSYKSKEVSQSIFTRSQDPPGSLS
jgi:hypothetical protein